MSLVMTCCHLLLLSFFVLPDPPRSCCFGERENEGETERERQRYVGEGGLSCCWAVWPGLSCMCRGSLWWAAAMGLCFQSGDQSSALFLALCGP